MTRSARSVALVTSDSSFQVSGVAATPPIVIERHPWSDDLGPLDARVLVEQIAADGSLALCLAADVPEVLALEISRLIDELHAEIGVVMVRDPNADLWREAVRAGVRDIIAPDAVDTDLVPALQQAVERGARLSSVSGAAAEPSAPHGKVIVILSPKGGSGKTMVASNVAVALATTHTGETVVVDLDCVFGDIASVLGMVPEHTIGQLASLPNFDSATLKVFLGRHEQSGLHVLAGSGLPEEGEAVTDKLVGQIIQMLARDFAYVVIDTAAGLDERALAAVEHSTDVVLLASMDVTSIRNLAKEINTLDRLDMVEQRRHFILNRADTRVGLEVSDVESVIGMKVDAALPSSRLVPLSMNQGTLVVLEESESAVAQQLRAFASRFTPETSGPNPSSTSQARQRRSWFRRR